MKSISNKREEFTISDFEKGLMLAGFISPRNSNEVKERQKLEEHDKNLREFKKNQYFKRAILAAEIVNELKDEKTFGRVKFQKLVYLCENAVHMNLSDERYKKFAAGPFDNRFMHSINEEFKKQKWFEVKTIKDGIYSKPQFIELENKDKYKDYYKKYYSAYDRSIQRIISQLKTQKTDFVELVATIFYCWREIINEKRSFSNNLIYEKVYSWAKEKERFSTADIDKAIKWMEMENMTPISI